MDKNNESPDELRLEVSLSPAKEGLMETITIIPVFKENPDAEFKRFDHLREFKMMATIVSIPPLWNNNVVAGKLSGGSSLLKFIEKEEKIGSYNIETSDGSFTVHLNEQKELSSASTTLKAKDFNGAIKFFLSLVNPYLSILSWKYKVPLTLSNINGIDIENSYQFAKFIQPVLNKSIQTIAGETELFDDRLLALFSFQREMINSTSGSYRLLCVYKCLTIVNAIKNDIRQKVIKKHLDTKTFKDLTEVIIENTDINLNVWPDAIGWKLSRLLNEKIRPLRNKIAHEFDSNTDFANPDLGIFGEQVRDYADALIPLMRLAFEKMVDSHDKYLS
jgi:hypothetical protein